MPLYYNAGEHFPGINSITSTATDLKLRDFLLSKNIQNPIKYPKLSTSINGGPRGGEPVLDTMVNSGVVNNLPSIEDDGKLRYNIAVLPNKYINTDSSAPSLLNIETTPSTPIFPTPSNGTVEYNKEDFSKYGILAKSDFKKYREVSTLKNLYVDTRNQIDIADSINLQPVQTSSQVKGGYLDEYGSLNLGQGSSVKAADILGSVLNGQGIGIGGGSVVSNFDIRSSLAGRVLNAAGILKDSRLGVIGGQQLALALGNNAAFNVEQQLLGKLNVQENIVSLIKGNGFSGLRPNYTITTPSSTGGKILSFAEKILGFNVPHSFLSQSASIFTSESGVQDDVTRSNEMLKNTGTGQIAALATNISANLFGSGQGYDNPNTSPFRSGYAPGYKDKKGYELFVPVAYAYMTTGGTFDTVIGTITNSEPIPNISVNREKLTEGYGFISYDNDTYQVKNNPSNDTLAFRTNFTWTSNNGKSVNSLPDYELLHQYSDATSKSKKSLLYKTQTLFNSNNMKNLVSVKGDYGVKTQIQTSISPNNLISKGSGVLASSKFNDNGTLKFGKDENAENTFCRVWTPYNRYSTLENLIRHRGLDQQDQSGESFFVGKNNNSSWRPNREISHLGSVLDDNGFVKIGPYKNDDHENEEGRIKTNPKKYMFSIENLAWGDSESQLNLLPEEKGPGDLLTGTYGKIMWFPPYDITFSESSSVNLESTNFIGRGEPIYTYNNTERIGNLSFKIVVDHPSVMNAFGEDTNVTDEFIDSYFAGCTDLSPYWLDKLTGVKDNVETEKIVDVDKQVIEPVIKPTDFKIYFPNDITKVETILGELDYELKPSGSLNGITYEGEPQYKSANDKNPKSRYFGDKISYGLNLLKTSVDGKDFNGWNDTSYLSTLKQYFNDNKTLKITVKGSASNQINTPYANKQLAINRAKNVANYLISLGFDKKRVIPDINNSEPSNNTSYNNNTPNTNLNVKKDRFASVTFEFLPEKNDTTEDKKIPKTKNKITISKSIKRRFYTEVNFFEKLKNGDPSKNIKADPFIFDKIREKIKYFHPAFHSTTPEGLNSRLTFLLQCTKAGRTNINDNPKNLAFGRQPVCILRIGDFYNTKIMMDNVSFDFEPLVWDLNPEGIGVQPMIANVTISFKFIGGSSLYGPINKLQNALSFNYFANSQVYDPRADYITGTNGSEYKLKTGITGMSKDYMKTEIIETKITDNDLNQVEMKDNITSLPISVSNTSSSDKEPKILGFNQYEIYETIDNNVYTFKVIINTKNIFDISNGVTNQIISDSELKNFVDKGIKITLEDSVNPSVYSDSLIIATPEYVPIHDKDLGNGFKCVKNCNNTLSQAVSIGIYLGSPTKGFNAAVKLYNGTYVLKLSYNGTIIQQSMIQIPFNGSHLEVNF